MEENICYHIPAMRDECLDALDIRPNGVYVDATFGGGGHSRAIIQELGSEGRLYGIDQDIDAKANSIDDSRFNFIRGNFRYLRNFLNYCGEEEVDGIIADLGVSFHHFDAAERGFSFRTDAPLDMRMNRNAEITAADLLERYDEEQLTDLLRRFTDLKQPGRIARKLISERDSSPIKTTGRLAKIAEDLFGQKQFKKDAAQLFQALRIEVNHETDALSRFLLSTTDLLKPGGRLVILTYHSIEDRMVKNFMRSGNLQGETAKDFYGNLQSPWKQIVKGVRAGDAEVAINPRARSARLRAAERREKE